MRLRETNNQKENKMRKEHLNWYKETLIKIESIVDNSNRICLRTWLNVWLRTKNDTTALFINTLISGLEK